MKHVTLFTALSLSAAVSAQIVDPSFELIGAGGMEWTQASTNFGTPLCDGASCLGSAASNFANTGTFWIWFGGVDTTGTLPEVGSVEQTTTFAAGSTGTLNMMVWIAAPSGNANDKLEAMVDGNLLGTLYMVDTVDFGMDYAMWSVDVATYLDGGMHSVTIMGTQTDGNDASNVFVDDVSLTVDGMTIGLFENKQLEGVKVYPNPTNDLIALNFNGMTGTAFVSITDVTGQLVHASRIPSVQSGVFQMDCGSFANGAYMVTVEQNGKRFAERIVVAH